MKICWYGHAAFLVETLGVRIIIDPFRSPDSGGYRPISEPASVVFVSHENDRYHSHLGQITPPFEVIRGLEVPPRGVQSHGLHFRTVPCFESPERRIGDEVTILYFESEELKVVHLGDLGHPLTPEAGAPLQGAEVVMVPVGGPPTIDLSEAAQLLDTIKPRLILPMHYKTPGINLAIEPVERFLGQMPGVDVVQPGVSTLDVTRANLPASPTIVVLESAR